jgi:hypothetical protein
MTQAAPEPTQPANEEPKEAQLPPIPPSLWSEYEGSQVFIQLRDGIEYMAVSYPGEPVVQAEVPNETGERQRVFLLASKAAQLGVQGEPITARIMQGVLRIKQDVYGVMLQLEFPDPVSPPTAPGERPRSMVRVIFPPDFVGFMSAIEQNLIR